MNRVVIRILIICALLILPTFAIYAHGGEEEADTPTETVNTDGGNEANTESHSENDDSDHTVDEVHDESTIWSVFISLGASIIAVAGTWYFFRDGFSILHYGIVGLIVITGVIHFIFGLRGDDLLFMNGVGYIVLAGIRFLPQFRQLQFRRVLDGVTIIYAGITIAGYLLTHSTFDTVGIITKVVEVLLVGLLLYQLTKRPTILVQV